MSARVRAANYGIVSAPFDLASHHQDRTHRNLSILRGALGFSQCPFHEPFVGLLVVQCICIADHTSPTSPRQAMPPGTTSTIRTPRPRVGQTFILTTSTPHCQERHIQPTHQACAKPGYCAPSIPS